MDVQDNDTVSNLSVIQNDCKSSDKFVDIVDLPPSKIFINGLLTTVLICFLLQGPACDPQEVDPGLKLQCLR